MEIGPETSLGEIAAHLEAALPAFEGWGIDYTCEGNDSLQEACRKVGVPLEDAFSELARLQRDSSLPDSHWEWRPLADLVDHILQRHHTFTRVQIERIHTLLLEAVRMHGFKHPQLLMLKELFLEMGGEMRGHMSREEEQLFPFLVARELAEKTRLDLPNPFLDSPFFRQPIRILQWEHRMTGEEWVQVRLLTDNFKAAPGAAPTLLSLYGELRRLEQDLHRHVHLENNILFKRAIEKGWVQ
jgi:regulator of cell morphogenesis and NO signaling